MSFAKLTISDFIDQQLPDFIVSEFPTFVKFFEEYYKSLEIKGGVLDVLNNIIEYKDFDNLKKNNLISFTELDQNINKTQTDIRLTSLEGFEKENGIILVDDEIIFYQSVDSATKTLVNCQRGYSATTELKEYGTSVSTSVASTHLKGTQVKNLSNLFLFSIIKNYQKQYLEGFPYTEIDSDIDPVTILTNIKDFYRYKGTTLSIEFLFRSIFDEEVQVKYPKDYLIKSSYSDWTVDDIIKVEAISGDPYSIVGNEIKQTDVAGGSNITAIIDTILVNNISNYASGNKNIYEIRLNILNTSNFSVPSETLLRRSLNSADSTITVDSTIGFPDRNGIIQIDDEIITYRYKSFNQFFDCSRGSYDTTATTHSDLSPVRTTEYLYAYSGGIEAPENLVKMRLLGVMSSTTINEGSSYYNEGENINISEDGVIDSKKQFTTWKINEDGNLASSSNTEINNVIKNISTEVSAVYKTDKFSYIASTGLPNHPVGPFVGVGNNIENQYLLKCIPLKTEKITQVQEVGIRAVGLFINGVEAYSCKDTDFVTFGGIESIEIINNGYGFDDNIQPVFRILNASGTGATFNANISNGKIISVDVVNSGNNYNTDLPVEITYGFDATATILNDTDIVNGVIKTITVTNGGNNYVVPPNVVITDITGRGKGAYAKANISNGVVTSIDVLSGGIDYSDKSNIRISIVSKGTGVNAIARVKKWNYDRVFKLLNSQRNNTWVLDQNTKIDAGNGYLYQSPDIRFGLQYAYAHNPKLLRSSLNDNVRGPSFDYSEITSGFTHSPIIGWAYDGNPIYGPYGYSDAADSASAIKRMESSYSLVTNVPSNRPSVSQYPLGAFIEDYEYISNSGDLDNNNGRFCKTPDFPEGTYAYFITVDAFGKGVFPYIIGKTYNSIPSKINFDILHNQQDESSLPEEARRIRTAKTPNKGYDAKLLVNDIQRGVVDNFIVSDSTPNFKVGDFLYINNTNTEGSGSLGSVESVFGVTVSSVTYAVASGYSVSGVTITNGITQFPFPTKITAANYNIPYEAYITTNENHQLSDNDTVVLNIDSSVLQTTKTYKIRTGTYQTVKYVKPTVTTTLDADVSFNQTTVNVINASNFRNNDYIKINDEILKIVSINYNNNQLTVLRSQFNTPLRLHAATNSVFLYIPESQNDYRINVGDSINSAGVSGTIYSIDKENTTFEVRIISGNLTNSSVINDNSTPSPRQIAITSVTTKKTYWEIDPSNTGNHYVRDLSFDFVRGTRYIIDNSDGSNFGYNMLFTEDSSNINLIPNIEYFGTPGTAGSYILIGHTTLNENISRAYYYEQNKLVENNRAFFSVKNNYFSGIHKIKILGPKTFKYSLQQQPEALSYTNSEYFTYSKSSIGRISTIKNLDGGEGYKSLPLVEGLVHSDLDNAIFAYSVSGGSIENTISVISQGNRYSSDTVLKVISSTGSGASLKPTILNGKIISVEVIDGGRGYSENDSIIAIDTSAQVFPVSNSIGKIKSTRFANFGTQFNTDRTLSKKLIFNYKLIITNLSDDIYKNSEFLTTSNSAVLQTISTQKIGYKSYLINVKLISGEILPNTIITGSIKQTTSTIYEVKVAEVFAKVSGYVNRVGFFDSDLGKLNSSSQKITDSYYYQDFSYVIRSKQSLNNYRELVNKSTHPIGFKLFGEVAIENTSDITTSGVSGSGSVTIPPDYRDNTVIIIPASGIKVESQLNYRRYEVQTVNTRSPRAIQGKGAALLNFLDNQIESVKISDISSQFNSTETNFDLSSGDGSNFPTDTVNTSVVLAINEIFQEPYELKNISSITYDRNVATITTQGDHGYAYTSSGLTYPVDLYVHISGVTPSGNINFNDKFEIYSVDSPNTFKVLINNPNGYLTNNDPGVCADVQSTVDNLIGILTTKLSNPSGMTLPIRNTGIWATTSGNSTIVSANRHRDASNLIAANRQEIIDRANAEIGVQYPDFYYPNDPQTTSYSRFKDSYRLIQLNKQEIIDTAFAEIAIQHPTFVNPNSTKCKRDIGYFIDAVSLDLHTGGNRYVIEFLKQYFNATGSSLTLNGLQGEITESLTAFNKARDLMKSAITNQLTVKDLTLTPDPSPSSGSVSNTNPNSCANVRTTIDNLSGIVTFYLNQGSLTYPTALPTVNSGVTTSGETKCKRDIGYIVDAVVLDLYTGGNSNIIDATNAYLTASGVTLIPNGVDGEVPQSVVAFNKARDIMKLALTNQLYAKDFSILPDFLSTSGQVSASRLTNAKLVKGQYSYSNNSVTLYEAPKEGANFYSVIHKFTNGSDNVRYSYKLKNILFDGVTKEFNLYKSDGSNLLTEQDENLLVFIDGVLQIYGESYTINRSVYPNRIVFDEAFEADRNFFAYSFSKYKILNNISSRFNDRETVFDLKFGDDNIKLPDIHQLLVLLDGVPQNEGDSYSVTDNILTFTEAPAKDKRCHLFYFYGKTFDKTISIWNGEFFERLQYIGENTPDGCKYFNKIDKTFDYIKSGDLIKIDGETEKELIGVEQKVLENSDNYVYTAFVYTDNSYIRGKNAVATAIVSGVTVPTANVVTISGTVAISGTTGIPSVYDYKVVDIEVNDGGLEYDTAPTVLFRTECDNPGRGAEAYATIQNGRVSSVTITNPGSGYTSPPEIIFAKRYEIIRQQYPLYNSKEFIVDVRANDGIALLISPGLTIFSASGREEALELPSVQVQLSSTINNTIQIENNANSDPKAPALAYVLQTFDQNKFKYEPLNLNDPLSQYLGTNVNIENVSRYLPNLTIQDFVERPGRTTGSADTVILNYGEDSYISFGLTLATNISDTDQTITVSGNVSNLPPSGYIEFGNELVSYSTISGATLLNCQRGVLNTSATSHNAGEYIRLAWRG